jgi:hypothetical protein
MSKALQQNPTENKTKVDRSLLTNEQVNYLLVQFGQFKRQSEVKVALKRAFDRDVATSTLYEFERRYKTEIQRIRQTWVDNLSEEAGSHKRVRVQQLWHLYCVLLDDLPKIPGYYKEEVQGSAQYLINNTVQKMESLLNSIRVEMEGNTLNVNYRDLSKQDDHNLVETARNVFNKIDPSFIEDAIFKDNEEEEKDKKEDDKK